MFNLNMDITVVCDGCNTTRVNPKHPCIVCSFRATMQGPSSRSVNHRPEPVPNPEPAPDYPAQPPQRPDVVDGDNQENP